MKLKRRALVKTSNPYFIAYEYALGRVLNVKLSVLGEASSLVPFYWKTQHLSKVNVILNLRFVLRLV